MTNTSMTNKPSIVSPERVLLKVTKDFYHTMDLKSVLCFLKVIVI